MEENPFMTVNISLKGFPVMDDTKLLQVQTEGYLPQLQPRSASLAQQLVHLLQQVLVLSPASHDVQAPEHHPRGRPPGCRCRICIWPC